MQPIEKPATAAWGLSLNDEDFIKLKCGLIARGMDDRWVFIPLTDQELPDELSAEKIATTSGAPNGVPTGQAPSDEVPTDEQLLADLETVEPDAERTEPPPAKVPTEEDLRQGGHISIRRAWTNTENYRLVLTVQPSESGLDKKIEAITWEQGQGHTSEEQAKTDVIILCRSHLGCCLAAAPDHDNSEFTGV